MATPPVLTIIKQQEALIQTPHQTPILSPPVNFLSQYENHHRAEVIAYAAAMQSRMATSGVKAIVVTAGNIEIQFEGPRQA